MIRTYSHGIEIKSLLMERKEPINLNGNMLVLDDSIWTGTLTVPLFIFLSSAVTYLIPCLKISEFKLHSNSHVLRLTKMITSLLWHTPS